MRKRQFTPTLDGRLEERVVLSTAVAQIHHLAPFNVSQRAINRAQARIDAAFNRAANDFYNAYKAAVRCGGWQDNGWAVARLQQAGARLGDRLAHELAVSVYGLPYAARDLSPLLAQIGRDLGAKLASFDTLTEMRTSGRSTFGPAWAQASNVLHDAAFNWHGPV